MNSTTETQTGTFEDLYNWTSLGADNTTSNPNRTDNSTTPDGNRYFEAAVLVPAVWSILIVIGLLGNGLVVYVLVRYGERKATNCYILNLAFSDLAFIMVSVPFTMTYYVMTQWIFGSTLCKLQMYMVYVTLQTTCLTLTAMTMDRYFVIVHPIRSMEIRTPRLALIVSVAIWAVSLATCIPFALYHGLMKDSDDGRTYCRETYPSHAAGRVAIVAVVVVTYVLPFAIILVCYTLMIRHLWRQAATTANGNYGPHHMASALAKLQLRKRRKATKMVAVVSILFVTLWLPIHVFQLWYKFDAGFPKNRITYDFKILAHSLSFASSVVNPFVYSFLGDGFQKATRKAFPFLFRRRQVRPASQLTLQGADRGTPSTTLLLAANLDWLLAGPSGAGRPLVPRSPVPSSSAPSSAKLTTTTTMMTVECSAGAVSRRQDIELDVLQEVDSNSRANK